MYIVISMDHVFVFDTRPEYKTFLDTLFSHAINGKILYMTMAESMRDYMLHDATSSLPSPIPGIDMTHILFSSLQELYKMYGIIYDPEGSIYMVTNDGELKSGKKVKWQEQKN